VNEVIFENLRWPSWIIPRVISWMQPIDQESVQDYSGRLARQIFNSPDHGQYAFASTDFMILGVSFGGIVAVEISKILSCPLVVLVSSVRAPSDMPAAARLLRYHWIAKLISKCGRSKTIFTRWGAQLLLGASKDEAEQLLEIFRSADFKLVCWSLLAIGRWSTSTRSADVYQIHGERDWLFPLWAVNNPNEILPTGGHLSIMTHAPLISRLIEAQARSIFSRNDA